MPKAHELPIPDIALNDPRARELARIWAAEGAMHIALAADVWDDPVAWGIALVDLARHIARAYEQMSKMATADALQRIRTGFDAEWDHPTDEPQGKVQ